MKRIIPLLALLLLILAACGEQSTTAASTAPTQASQPTPSPTAAANHHKLGETVKIYYQWTIKVKSTIAKDKNVLSSGLEQVPDSPSHQFLIITVSVQNTSVVDQPFTKDDFTVKDDKHYTYQSGPVLSDSVTPIPDGTIASKDTSAGDIVFQVPRDEKHFTLIYKGPPATSKDPNPTLFVWDITL